MLESGITPDFITVDGGEGGTGAAPTEMTNSVGTPLRDAPDICQQSVDWHCLRDKVRVIASGKVFSAFHLLRVVASGGRYRQFRPWHDVLPGVYSIPFL